MLRHCRRVSRSLVMVLAGAALAIAGAQNPGAGQSQSAAAQSTSQALIDAGRSLFRQQCAFCHGRDAGGGETGPDLTSSPLVAQDIGGDKIGVVVRNGRIEKGMPRFNLSQQDIAALAAFIHDQKEKASRLGGRRKVSAADLQSGNPELGKQYFYGPGTCSKCHSPTGDLAGIARKYTPLRLLERMLYPANSPAQVTVKLPSGQMISGKLEYLDEFTVGLRDASGYYRSWLTKDVTYKVEAPAEEHVSLLSKYTDDDMHNLLAYLQTLK